MPPTPPDLRLVLASSSPRRRDLLDSLGLAFVVRPAHADEAAHADETSSAFVERLAREKAAKVAGAGELVLAADTTVVHGGRRLGKPADPAEAAWMLRELSGETHQVSTGVAIRVIRGPGAIASASTVCTTRVTFSPLGDRDIDWYVATGEPLDKAGAYGIQSAGGLFVERIEGSYTNVVGLPLAETAALMRGRGIDLLDFTR